MKFKDSPSQYLLPRVSPFKKNSRRTCTSLIDQWRVVCPWLPTALWTKGSPWSGTGDRELMPVLTAIDSQER